MPSTPFTAAPGRRARPAALGLALSGLAIWLILRNWRQDGLDSWIFWAPMALWLLAMGLLCWWSALAGQHPTARFRIAAAWRMGWILGGAGLVLGFIGPLLVTPAANLGPLLGILITGPGGFVLGAVGGAVTGAAQRRPF